MNKIIIVDENDEIIGSKKFEEIKQADTYRVSALWIENSSEAVLLAQRSFQKKNNPGKWGPAVAGTIEEGETYESNVYKEAEEEIGLKGEVFKKAHKIKRTGKRNYFCQWYYLQIDKKLDYFKIQEDEVEQIRWFSTKELKAELKNNPDKFLGSMGKILETIKDKLI